MKSILLSLCAAGAIWAGTVAPGNPNPLFAAIRANDVATLKSLLAKGADPNMRGDRQTTPLMYAAAYGGLEAFEALLSKGADPNAKNALDATALMWAAGDYTRVKLLLAKGAEVNVQSKIGRTPLMLAASRDGNSRTVRLLLDKGAKVNVLDNHKASALLLAGAASDAASIKMLLDAGADANAADEFGFTPLIAAAAKSNLEGARLLLAKRANVNAQSKSSNGEQVKNGLIQLGSFTPLSAAATWGPPALVKTLLDAGASVNVPDVRGMTPLMLAVTSESQNPEIVKMLLDHGADPKLKSKTGETALDWAGKFNHPDILGLLGGEPAAAESSLPAAKSGADLKAAVTRGLGLLQKTGGTSFMGGGCASCHNHHVPTITYGVAKSKGLPIYEKAIEEYAAGNKAFLGGMQEVILQRIDPPGANVTDNMTLAGFRAAGVRADDVTATIAINVAAMQRADGSWSLGLVSRTPMMDGRIEETAWSILSLKTYGPAGLKAEFETRIQRARDFLLEEKPRYNSDRTMQLLGLKWAGAPQEVIDRKAKELIAEQRADGGWSQNRYLSSDAYATGLTLYALHEAAGLNPADDVYRRAAAYLLASQKEDGSWFVRSRAPKFQPYFDGGFPYAHDQWISVTATAWATAALTFAL